MDNPQSRRQAIKAIGATVAVAVIPGCGAAVQTLQQVLVSVPWTKVLSIVSSFLLVANRTISVSAKLEGQDDDATYEATLGEPEANLLTDGAKLLIRTKDGKEFDLTPTIK